MSIICTCSGGAALPDIPTLECEKRIGQIQKLIFQRTFSDGSTENVFVIATNNPNVLASWSPLLVAIDGTKAVATPFVENPEMTAGEARTTGGGNASVGGVTRILGGSPSTFTSVIKNAPQDIISELKKLTCEKNLSVYFINEKGLIIGEGDGGTNFKGMPIQSLFVGDLAAGGYEDDDMNALNFELPECWSDNLEFIEPTDFNAKTDLNI